MALALAGCQGLLWLWSVDAPVTATAALCLQTASARARGDPVDGPNSFVSIRLPATNQMLQGRTSWISFLFRNQEAWVSSHE